ncbi:MAG TPA: BON domain-containing protein [Terriglobales bacterium]|jgi:osmotically-inducible protein OsmY|nr:BON domain-containing protein [Terriglobales bacterium]
MKTIFRTVASFLTVGILSAGLVAQTASARYDSDIQTRVTQQLAKNKDFRNLQASTEDGIVTLAGTVDLYQQKLDASKKVRKLDKVQGVRNEVAVSSTAPDAELAAKLERKLHYDRIGYDNLFNFVSVSVDKGVATLSGETLTYMGRDSALSLVNNMPGVKDVIDNVKVSPASGFDDRIRLSALRAIYHDSVLSRYASDPAKPIRIVVDNGKLSLYGTVATTMDKQVAGIRANQVFGVFSVQNNLEVVKGS